MAEPVDATPTDPTDPTAPEPAADPAVGGSGTGSGPGGPSPDEVEGPEGSGWAHRYPPLLSVLAALVIALAIMPSSLNITQPNPTQTLEFAPVPPEQDDPPPPPESANFADLGLGDSESVEGGGAPGDGAGPTSLPPPPPPPGQGATPVTKQCVEGRQTEDPLSPPCVAFFEGDNFGATYQGVTGEEIRLLVYVDGNVQEVGCSTGTCPRPDGETYDLFEPENPADDPNENSKHLIVRGLRVWQRYFNERFQTYGRVVHFWVKFSGFDQEPENRRADAAQAYADITPFAVISDASDNENAFLEAMAQKGVLNFGSLFGRSEAFFNRYPGMIWGLQPSLERQRLVYSSYVCSKVIGQPAVLAGNTDLDPVPETGEPRRIGVIHTTDDNFPGLVALAEGIKDDIEACGGTIEAVGTYPRCCFAKDNSRTHEYANTQMAEFQQKGITTILYLGGVNGYYGPAADALGYQPEWIIAGDGTMDGNNPVRLASFNGTWDGRGITVSAQPFQPALQQQICYQAFRSVDTTFPESDLGFVCDYYDNLFQLFVGIQVAGPRLGPTSINQGFHAIPEVRSSDPRVPACFYLPNDYTCIKDGTAKIWDADGQAPGDSRPGCWRAIEGGARYLPGEWPEGNIDAQLTGDEPCSGYSAGVLIDPA